MSSTPTRSEQTARSPNAATVDMKLEVVVIPVSDVDRAKRFYGGLGWRLDADLAIGPDRRVVQLTPPGSDCSIHFGKGITKAVPGSAQGMILVVYDNESARAELIGHGVDVSEAFHFGANGPVPGADPEGRSYATRASFNDPDGNGWVLQEIKTRLPGRGLGNDVGTLTELLREAEEQTAESISGQASLERSDLSTKGTLSARKTRIVQPKQFCQRRNIKCCITLISALSIRHPCRKRISSLFGPAKPKQLWVQRRRAWSSTSGNVWALGV